MGFISYFHAETEPSTAVSYLAHHAIAAYYADALDKEVWRNAVIAYLSQVSDDTADYPVWALGVATWALAQTGPLDDTLVKQPGLGEPIWVGVTLSDLPDLLLSHQQATGPYTGSFFWRFDHTDGAGGSGTEECHGFTEDNAYGVLGLAATIKADPGRSNAGQIETWIAATKSLLPLGIEPDGSVWGHLWLSSEVHTFYGGRMLTALSGANVIGDINMDDVINLEDLKIFAEDFWLDDCNCRGDVNEDGIVNFTDYAMGLAKNWLFGVP